MAFFISKKYTLKETIIGEYTFTCTIYGVNFII